MQESVQVGLRKYRLTLKDGTSLMFDAESFRFSTERMHDARGPEIRDRMVMRGYKGSAISFMGFVDRIEKLEPI